jgi:hypothetical protein
MLELACLAPTIKPRSKSLVLPILMFNQTVTECLNACLPALYTVAILACKSWWGKTKKSVMHSSKATTHTTLNNT